jgi:hypothetical protein
MKVVAVRRREEASISLDEKRDTWLGKKVESRGGVDT